MLFTSAPFFVLLVFTFAVFYVRQSAVWQTGILIGSSFVFYAWKQPILLSLLLFSVAANAFTSWKVAQFADDAVGARWAFWGVAINLLVLGTFKYGGLLTSTGLGLAGIRSGRASDILLSLPLPIGISFYTFEGISLLVDCHKRGELRESVRTRTLGHHLGMTALFTAFFPHLIAGPILRARDFFPQVGVKRFQDIQWDPALRTLIVGFFLKTFVADNLADQTAIIAFPYFMPMSSLTAWTVLYGYGAQIFADFAGYSLIAVGLAHLFGYQLPDNFRFPYMSRSLAEIWTRWHITLSSWIRDYVYIPLGGNRNGKLHTALALLVAMTLGGLWHGAAWKFVLWGVANGLGLVIERLVFGRVRLSSSWGIVDWVRVAGVGLFWSFTLLLFKLPSVKEVGEYIHLMTGRWGQVNDVRLITAVVFFSLPVAVYHLAGHGPLADAWSRVKTKGGLGARLVSATAYAFMIFLIITNRGNAGDFIYFQF